MTDKKQHPLQDGVFNNADVDDDDGADEVFNQVSSLELLEPPSDEAVEVHVKKGEE